MGSQPARWRGRRRDFSGRHRDQPAGSGEAEEQVASFANIQACRAASEPADPGIDCYHGERLGCQHRVGRGHGPGQELEITSDDLHPVEGGHHPLYCYSTASMAVLASSNLRPKWANSEPGPDGWVSDISPSAAIASLFPASSRAPREGPSCAYADAVVCQDGCNTTGSVEKVYAGRIEGSSFGAS